MLKLKAYSKGILLIIAGLIIAFFPGVISGLAGIIGGIIIAFCVVSLILKLAVFKTSDIGINIAGIIVGAVISVLPSLITVGVPIIAGILLASAGVERAYGAYLLHCSGQKCTVNAVTAIILILISGFMFFNPFETTNFIKIIIGLIMIGAGVFYIFTERKNQKLRSDIQPDIIDVTNYTVK